MNLLYVKTQTKTIWTSVFIEAFNLCYDSCAVHFRELTYDISFWKQPLFLMRLKMVLDMNTTKQYRSIVILLPEGNVPCQLENNTFNRIIVYIIIESIESKQSDNSFSIKSRH